MISDLDEDFRDQIGLLVPKFFDNLVRPKEVRFRYEDIETTCYSQIGGVSLTGAQFLSFFQTYVKIFGSGSVPEPKSVYEVYTLVDRLEKETCRPPWRSVIRPLREKLWSSTSSK